MGYVMGIDGGGSQTTAVMADESGCVVSIGRSEGANHQGIGMEGASQHLVEAVEGALSQAGVGRDGVDFFQYGLAGADRDRDFAILRDGLGRLPYGPWEVVSDAWEGLRAGTDDFVGVSVVCGSGTNAVGRNRRGHEVQVGGFGYLFGDTAGGRDLAHEGFRAAVRSWQRRGPATVLTDLIPARFGLRDMEQVYNHCLDNDTPIPLDLAILVHRAAEAGDVVAQGMLQYMGRELGLAANAVLDHLGIDDEPMPIVLVGSVVQKGQSRFLLNALEDTVLGRFDAAYLRMLDVPPVYGAVLLALDHLGRPVGLEARHTYQGWEE